MFGSGSCAEPGLQQEVDGIGAVDAAPVGGLADEELRRAIPELQAHIFAAEARKLELMAEYDRRELYGDDLAKSTGHWVGWKCGLPPRVASEQVKVARAIEGLTQIKDGFGSGELSFHQVSALSKVATPETEQMLIGWAKDCTVGQLNRVTASYRRVSKPAAGDPDDDLRYKEFFHYFVDEDDFTNVRARLGPEKGAGFVEAMEDVREQLLRDASSQEKEERRPFYDATTADAFALLCESYIAGQPREANRVITAHIDVDVLAGLSEHGRCHTEEGMALPLETLERWACDCSVIPVLESNGELLDIGRKSRNIPTGMRRAMVQRDGGCRFPGCGQKRFIQGHHVEYWTRDLGPTKLPNLLSLCRYHHRCLHEGGYFIRENRTGQLEFVSPTGKVLNGGPSLGVRGPNLKQRHLRKGLHLTHRTTESTWDGSTVDLDLVVWCMTQMKLRC